VGFGTCRNQPGKKGAFTSKLAKDVTGKMANLNGPNPILSAPIQFSHAIFI
jgi:hypothetical protein